MTEENKEAVESKEAKENVVEEKESIDPDEVQSLRERLQLAQEKARRYDDMNRRYLEDNDFRSKFDAAWERRQLEKEVKRVEASIDSDTDPVTLLKSELQKSQEESLRLQQRLGQLENNYTEDRQINNQREISLRYEDEFMEMASKAGYEPGTEAYEILFTKAEKEGYNVAKALGVNLFDQFNPKIVRKAFDAALGKMKKAGFDDAWQKRQQVLKQEQEQKRQQKQSDGPNLDKFFTKEILKQRNGPAKAMEAAFNARFPNRADIKL